MIIKELVKTDGTNPFRNWFNSLNAQAAAKIAVAIDRIVLGNLSNIKWLGGIGEYRINWGPGYRIYLTKKGRNMIILLHGGIKKTQTSDINYAKALYTFLKGNK